MGGMKEGRRKGDRKEGKERKKGGKERKRMKDRKEGGKGRRN